MARNFNGTTSDKIAIASATPINITGTAFSFSIWFRKADVGTRRYLFGKGGGGTTLTYVARVDAGNLAVFIIDDSTSVFDNVAATTAITANTWFHLVGVKSGTGAAALKLYQNGVLEGSSTSNLSLVSNANALWLGYQHTAATSEIWSGDLAEFGIWNAALDAAEAAALAKGVPPFLVRPQSLQLYKPLGGRASPEQELRNSNGGVVTGTAYADHPRMYGAGRRANATYTGWFWPFVSAAASSSSANDAGVLKVARGLTSAAASGSSSNDSAVITVLRPLVAAAASLSSGNDVAVLKILMPLLSAVASGSSSNDSAVLNAGRGLISAAASSSSTNDLALLTVNNVISFVSSVLSLSSSNDAAVLKVARGLTSAAASLSSSNDAAVLKVARALVSLAASVSSGNDAAVLNAGIKLISAVASSSSSNDAAVLKIARGLVSLAASVSSGNDAGVLKVARPIVSGVSSVSSSNDAAVLKVARALVSVASSSSSSNDAAVLKVARALLAVAASLSSTNDLAAFAPFLQALAENVFALFERRWSFVVPGSLAVYDVAAPRRVFEGLTMAVAEVVKDVEEVVDYAFDYTSLLQGDTIVTSAWSVDSGLVVDSDANTTTTTTARISGGTLNARLKAKNTIETSGGQTFVRRLVVLGAEL